MRFLHYFGGLLFPSFCVLGTRVTAYFWVSCLHAVANYDIVMMRDDDELMMNVDGDGDVEY